MPEPDAAPGRRDERSPRRRSGHRASGGGSGAGGAQSGAPLYGALDLGTNNCRLLIARPARDGFRVVDSFSRIVRLGEGLSLTGRLDAAAMDRTYDALAHCAERIGRKGLDASRLSAVATQACRAAENGQAFVERVRRGTGLNLRIIDPAEEARLSVQGCLNLFDPTADAVLVIDVGGGSTELSWLKRQGREMKTVAWMSAPLGVVTLAERHPEPPAGSPDENARWYEAMVADVSAALAAGCATDPALEVLRTSGRSHLVGTSGAITSLAGVHLNLRRYQRDLVDGLWMTRDQCDAATRRLRDMGAAGRAAEACIGPNRADLVLAGAAILDAVQRAWPCERVRVADRGLREGLLLERMQADRSLTRRRRRGRGRAPSGGAQTEGAGAPET
ncbi:MAG: Ppx/GppA phosphatase family protein [Brevundimonas sp.]|uniref:Ppx/GppA phosphatase family protein n=1 Tax=Brevundimonas sp. TaxID=1871086 RepID=UPI0040333B66